jgi:hypothetical protein
MKELAAMFHVPTTIADAIPMTGGKFFPYTIPGSLAVLVWENYMGLNRLKEASREGDFDVGSTITDDIPAPDPHSLDSSAARPQNDQELDAGYLLSSALEGGKED